MICDERSLQKNDQDRSGNHHERTRQFPPESLFMEQKASEEDTQ